MNPSFYDFTKHSHKVPNFRKRLMFFCFPLYTNAKVWNERHLFKLKTKVFSKILVLSWSLTLQEILVNTTIITTVEGSKTGYCNWIEILVTNHFFEPWVLIKVRNVMTDTKVYVVVVMVYRHLKLQGLLGLWKRFSFSFLFSLLIKNDTFSQQ